MKILFVQEYFYPIITGGAEIYSHYIVKKLLDEGHEVFVIAGGFSNKVEVIDDITIQRVNLMPSRFLFNVKSIFVIKKVLKKFNADLIHGNTHHATIPTGLMGYFKNIPTLISVHSLFLNKWRLYYDPFRSALFYAFERFQFKLPYEKIIACDLNSMFYLKVLGLEDKSVYIPYPIEIDKFYPKKKKKNKIVIGTLGRLYDKSKKLSIFFKLFDKYKDRKDIEFLFIGPYSPSQKETFKKFDNLRLVGKKQHSEIPNYLNDIDIFIGQGISAKEAMACGCVTILNEVEDRLIKYHRPELDRKALLSGNIFSLVERFIDDEKKREKQSKKAIKFIRVNYSAEKIFRKTLKVYEEILKN